ncbi:hypothetical protein [Polyangium fumosum]|uniref:Co-chaperone DjlA N-terminal domain-containing protein n=1 Tax=Polyangium fumosum TaxID=889272 RepID=A0A4U1J8X3_9BACT|nr:hypothetical protein [Polyangium fumosum]TKD03918.1 hypothetical protein E8A74_23975 [Polyangium fumosum]
MTTNRELGFLWSLKQKCNVDRLPTLEAFEGYLKAILTCANGDGNLTPAEREWVLGHGSAVGALDSLLEELKTYKADEDIEKLLAMSPQADASRRVLIYDAVRACSADGEYNDRERATVRKMGSKLGIAEDLIRQIEEIALEEARLWERRVKLVYPAGTPPTLRADAASSDPA